MQTVLWSSARWADGDVVLLGHDLPPLLGSEAAPDDGAGVLAPGGGVDLPAERAPVFVDREQPVSIGAEACRRVELARRAWKRKGRADRLLRADVPEYDRAVGVLGRQRSAVQGERDRQSGRLS